MTNKELFEAFSDIEPELIEKYAPNETLQTGISKLRTKKIIRKALLSAACFIALISIAACAKEAKDYETALEFFCEYNLSTEGMSRKEIKKVYRDIKTQSVTYSDNDENEPYSYLNSVQGYEISQNLNNGTNNYDKDIFDYLFSSDTTDTDGSRYKIRSEEKDDPYLGFSVHEKSFVEKYDGEKLLWSVETSDFVIVNLKIMSDCVIAFGETYTYSSEQQSQAYMMKMTKEGKVLWTKRLDNGFQDEYISSIIENKDGTFSVFSAGDYKDICLSVYDGDGVRKYFKKIDSDRFFIRNVALLSDGYILELEKHYPEEDKKFVILDSSGEITGSFTYTSPEKDYCFTDIIELGDKIYFSAYEVPKNGNELSSVFDYFISNYAWDEADEKTTKLIRDNYTARLLVCDKKEKRPKEFYSIKGALGGALEVNKKGELIWNTDSIKTVKFSPATSAYSFYGTCSVYRYVFGSDGTLLRAEKTKDVSPFYR